MKHPIVNYIEKKGITFHEMHFITKMSAKTLQLISEGISKPHRGTILQICESTNNDIKPEDFAKYYEWLLKNKGK